MIHPMMEGAFVDLIRRRPDLLENLVNGK